MPTAGVFVGGCVTLFIGCMLCSAAGVGGGGINVPILLLVFGYGFDTSVKLSLFAVLGNALAQNSLNFGKSHPKFTNLPLIFWELVIVLSPAQLGGSNIGNILAEILPDSILYIIALLILLFACYMSTKKALKRYEEEVKADKPKDSSTQKTSMSPIHSTQTTVTSSTESPVKTTRASLEEVDQETTIAQEIQTSKQALSALTQALDKEPVIQLPIRVMQVILLVWSIYTAIVVGLKFSTKCSTDYYILFVFLYVPLVSGNIWGVLNAASLGGSFHRDSHQGSSVEVRGTSTGGGDVEDHENSVNKRIRESLLHNDEENQVTILKENAFKMMIFTFLIGIICSLLGIGGGELLSPMMLAFHILPQVTSATSAMLSLINTSALVIRTLATSSGIWDTGIILFIIAFIGGFVGRKIGLIISFEYNRSSFIIFSLVVVLAISSLYYVVELSIMDFNVDVDSVC